MGAWIVNIGNGIKSVFTLISRVMKLEDRVTVLEENMRTLQAPPKDAKEDLEYIKNLNLYHSKATEEYFCPTCLGKDNKKIAIQIKNIDGARYWNCSACNSHGTDRTTMHTPPRQSKKLFSFGEDEQ